MRERGGEGGGAGRGGRWKRLGVSIRADDKRRTLAKWIIDYSIHVCRPRHVLACRIDPALHTQPFSCWPSSQPSADKDAWVSESLTWVVALRHTRDMSFIAARCAPLMPLPCSVVGCFFEDKMQVPRLAVSVQLVPLLATTPIKRANTPQNGTYSAVSSNSSGSSGVGQIFGVNLPRIKDGFDLTNSKGPTSCASVAPINAMLFWLP